MYYREPITITPEAPPGVTELIHRGIVVWWVLLVAGILAIAAATVPTIADLATKHLRRAVAGGGIVAALIGGLLIFLSY